MMIWYIFPVLVSCTKKNLATLLWRQKMAGRFAAQDLQLALALLCIGVAAQSGNLSPVLKSKLYSRSQSYDF
jgi:hypothetical protein